MRKFAGISAIAAIFLVGTGGRLQADLVTVLDQIGPTPAFVTTGNANASQIFESSLSPDNIAVIDNFSITTPGTTLTEVDAALLGFGGFTSGDYSAITAYRVEIYKSVADAASSLTGNVSDESVAPTSVTLTRPFGIDRYSALAHIAVDVTLGVGTYYLAVIPVLNYEPEGKQIGVYESTYAGDSNAYQVNPGGGFGLANDQRALNANAAYRILGETPSVATPEPGTIVLAVTSMPVSFFLWHRRRQRA